MNIVRICFAYLRFRLLQTVLNCLLLALGMMVVTFLLLSSHQLERRLDRDGRGVQLVVGAPGSKLQVVLSAVYHADIPTGNISYDVYEWLLAESVIAWALPLGLGDEYAGYRIVGTEPALASKFDVELTEGRFWETEFEAVLGAEAARTTGLAIGDQFISGHGLGGGETGHADHPYTVVGVLARGDAVVDRLILTSLQSLEQAHGHHHGGHLAHDHTHEDTEHADHHHGDNNQNHAGEGQTADKPSEITAVIAGYASPVGAVTLPPRLEHAHPVTAASPGEEIARLLNLVGIGFGVFHWFAGVLISAAALGVLIALYNAMRERRYDWAVMRCLGASPGQLLRLVLLEGTVLTMVGTVVGMASGHLAAEIVRNTLPQARTFGLTGQIFLPSELGLFLLAILVGLAASALPAFQAYRTPLAATLSS